MLLSFASKILVLRPDKQNIQLICTFNVPKLLAVAMLALLELH